MNQRNWIIQLILGVFILGVIILGLIAASFLILPIVAAGIIALPIYFWLKSRRGKKGPPGRGEETVKRSSYTVLDGEQKDSPQDGALREYEEDSYR